MPLTSGSKLGPYEILSAAGAGGMGEVYRARDLRLQRTVAIKVLPLHLSSDPDLHARFEQEAKSISGLQHPNVCVVHDIGSQDGVDFMVMEYLAGQTLDKLIPAGGLPTDVALKYAIQVAEALTCAHNAGVVHRDLKPSNIMVDSTGLVKVLDFGLAKMAVSTSSEAATLGVVATTSPGMIVGTVAYMSPEQAEGKPIDARSDVFSFGAVLYEMLSGKRAFEGESSAALLAAVIRDTPKPLNQSRRDIPAELSRIVTRCLRKEPEGRYASGAELAQELRKCREQLFPESGAMMSPARIAQEAGRPKVLIPMLLLLLIIGSGVTWLVKRSRDLHWAREVALPQISQLAEQGKSEEAYVLAVRAEKSIPSDPTLAKLWPLISFELTLDSLPTGAAVYRRPYNEANAPWEQVGTTPLKKARQAQGAFLLRIEKPGLATMLRVINRRIAGELQSSTPTMDESGKVPFGMVRVWPAKFPKTLFIPGFEGMPELDLNDYWIDRYEVTNREFKRFVDQGGYRKREYWKNDFQKDGKRLSWEEATAMFRDSAGQPGPKDWIQGQYPNGQDEYPVTGISWYEAAAYAEFAGKSLPSIYHWNRAAGPHLAAYIEPASNFGGTGVLPVGSKQNPSLFGTYDMAGNVKEWIWNEADSGKRYVLGGAWDEPNYMFIDPDARSPFLRAPNIGFRCVKYIAPESIPKVAMAAVPSPRRDVTKEKPVSDELFKAYRSLYSYDKIPLNASAEHFGKDEEDWTAEKITYTAAYGNERAIAYLFLPKKAKPPFQTVIFFPGSNALNLRTFAPYPTAALDAVLRSGRAVVYPIYKGTYERGDGMESDVPNLTSTWRDHVIMWAKDVSRAIDYVETRPELDSHKIAYYGYSWGAEQGGLVPAVEPRIKVCVFALGGIDFHHSLPEVDTINFVTHVKQPALLLNGRYDFFFPMESSQEVFFRLLGAKKEEKKHLLYDTGHNIPRNELIKESLSWFN
ncbi:MAG: serine/threonine protein kinase [Acidobacteriales bacterium]|nr:serine/threonine protein kinase [Terriglobales bacterium]